MCDGNKQVDGKKGENRKENGTLVEENCSGVVEYTDRMSCHQEGIEE